VTVAVKICDAWAAVTALPQLTWIFLGPCPLAGSIERPIVSPGHTLALPN
jgi:hypothetical protein